MIARTYSKMDPDFKLGLAKPKFEKLIVSSQSLIQLKMNLR